MALIIGSAIIWDDAHIWLRVVLVGVLLGMTVYNIIVVSHLFTHVPWFTTVALNSVVSVVNSVNIGQSVQAYELTHVRNHHRYNNDLPNEDGETNDRSSTYGGGRDGNHVPLARYALCGAIVSASDLARALGSTIRLWRLSARDVHLVALASRSTKKHRRELAQVRWDRAALSLTLLVLGVTSWQWLVTCYVPVYFCAAALVNVQNYYRHFGANPHERWADSVSHYGYWYNLFTFNDGYHQEHHLRPRAHWSQMPAIRERYRQRLDTQRVISPVPAIVGFLHRDRPQLHRSEQLS
ncbi:MAG: fatty acid desaturase [Pseudonocardiaceae bacterium]